MFEAIYSYFKRKFGRDRVYYQILKTIFGVYPNNIELYKLALIHRSASLFLDDGRPINNERLEFLGDAVIEAIVSDYLFIEYPEADEGLLSQLRSRLVSRSNLNHLAQSVGLDRQVIIQGGGAFQQKHLYGDAFEAMMGAIYLDKGYDYANRLLINDILGRFVDLDDLCQQDADYKSRLIEWSQKHKRSLRFDTKPSPFYTAKRPHFHTTIFISNEIAGEGTGGNKKESEQQASLAAMSGIEE